MNIIQKLGMFGIVLINRALKLFYNVIYFYFTPILVVIIVQMTDLKNLKAVAKYQFHD